MAVPRLAAEHGPYPARRRPATRTLRGAPGISAEDHAHPPVPHGIGEGGAHDTLATLRCMAGWTGLEPATSDVTGERNDTAHQRVPEIRQRAPATRPDTDDTKTRVYADSSDTRNAQTRDAAAPRRIARSRRMRGVRGDYFRRRGCAWKNAHAWREASTLVLVDPTNHSGIGPPPGQVWPPPRIV